MAAFYISLPLNMVYLQGKSQTAISYMGMKNYLNEELSESEETELQIKSLQSLPRLEI